MLQATLAKKWAAVPAPLQLGYQYYQRGQLKSAEDLCNQVLLERPDNAAAVHLLGLVLVKAGRFDEGIRLLRRSVALAPLTAEFHSNLGSTLAQAGQPREAVAALREAIRLQPAFGPAHRNLGLALVRSDRIDEAIEAMREASMLLPRDGETLSDLVALSLQTARAKEAVEHTRKLLSLRSDDVRLHSDLLLSLHYVWGSSAKAIYEETVAWAARFARPLYPNDTAGHANDPNPDRRLRVGYVSGDLRDHPIGRFTAPVIGAHDPHQFEVVCYSDVKQHDAVTARVKESSHQWHEVAELTDEELAARIRRDAVDILVDLTGHMELQRLLVFARKPAPVQVTYIGYPNTTGLATMDCRITDIWHDSPGRGDELHTERLARLTRCCWCCPVMGDEPAVADAPPSATGKPFTFGCMNRLPKVTPPMIRLLAQILAAVPGSRLRILVDRGADSAIVARLVDYGIDPCAIEVAHRASRAQYLSLFAGVDIHLDTFPYNGMTTTCEALWLGVPTVTLAGDTHVQRIGLSLLSAVGAVDLVADTPDDYVRIAVHLARDGARLLELRRTLRSRTQASVLMDARGLAAAIEEVYRDLWRDWCARRCNEGAG